MKCQLTAHGKVGSIILGVVNERVIFRHSRQSTAYVDYILSNALVSASIPPVLLLLFA